jgi:peptidoglycan/LPS O-acetylase OafA/YrhL
VVKRFREDPRRQLWVEFIKAFGLLWILINHITERFFGNPLIANPNSSWPALSVRLSQLQPLDGFGLWNIPINAFRYFGWSGDQGVQLFLIASGFGLTWGLLKKQAGQPLNLKQFYLRRAERIYPLWWGAHILFIGFWLLTGWGLSLFSRATVLSFFGIRTTPDLLYYFSPAWWYVGLIIQLYLVYPLLWGGLRKWGPAKLLLWSSIIAFSIRGAGLFLFDKYLDAWARGAIFITRLPEFVFGICLAAWLFSQPDSATQRLRNPITLLSAIALYILGTFLSLTLFGMTFAPFCLGVAAFIFLYRLFIRLIPIIPNWWISIGRWIGEHSYSIYLIHHPILLLLVPTGIAFFLPTAGRILAFIIISLVLALLLEVSVGFATRKINQLVKKLGVGKTIVVVVLLGATAFAFFIGAELFVRWVDPQEVMGWGERPSLVPDPEFSWRLKPSQTTRLRWESYDYWVTANSLGFPGPEYPIIKSKDAFRIFVTGDAFSSAEGVDTGQAWPRLLETRLAARMGGKNVEVLNFAITGYGPNQYEAVIQQYVPIYKPDLILLEIFVNDFQEVLSDDQARQDSIGFTQPEQNSIYGILRLVQLRRWIQLNLKEPMKEIYSGQPRPEGYFLGNFKALERGHPEIEINGKEMVFQRLQQIKLFADQNGAKLIVLMVPASVQVCAKNQLAYYPQGVDLTNRELYDTDLPQRLMSDLAISLALPFYDLRSPLEENSNMCPYQSHNMHWTSYGHQVVADYLVDILLKNGYLPK